MKSKWILTAFIGFLCFGLFFGFFVDTIAAQDYQVSIVDKSYNIHKISEVHGQIIIYYNISITLRNSGNSISDDITLEIVGDDEIPLYLNDTITPGSVKEFKWENEEFFLVGAMDHYINISYYPTGYPNEQNEDKSGKDSLILKYGEADGNEGTPGFEAVFLLMVIVGYVVIRKYKK